VLRASTIAAAFLAVAVAAGVAVAVASFRDTRRYKSTHLAQVKQLDVRSPLLGRTMTQVAVVPPRLANRRRPLLVLLHGRAMHPDGLLSEQLFRELRRLGPRAPIVLFPNGGDHSYFHDRRSGRWGSYVLGEVIPTAIRELGADPKRVALGGVSMGGFGALNLARRAPGRFCAIGAHSAALWQRAADTAPGAFDDAADFRRNDVVGYVRAIRRPYGSTPVWIDVGTHDPFSPVDSRVAQLLRARRAPMQFHMWDGSHDTRYWDRHMAAYLRFYSAELAACNQ
jgi:enterochelin esterase-like enzyme